MRKEILVDNYNPIGLKRARTDAKVSLEDVSENDIMDIDQLELHEAEVFPIDIFLIGTLLNFYEEKAIENEIEDYSISMTSDVMYPHPKGIEYQEFIVKHKNYEGLPYARNKENKIQWVATIQTTQGKERVKFWSKKLAEYKIAGDILDAGNRQKVALANHPTKKHTCLFTGSELYIDYRYPSPSRIDLLNREYNSEYCYYDLDILELASILYEEDKCIKFSKVFRISEKFENLTGLLEYLKSNFIARELNGYVSPGVMSNSPDRLDGYHSYNADVRDVIDTGRRRSNLKRYTQDRRAYEFWSEGDFNLANRLMGEYQRHQNQYKCPECGDESKMTPDHIGPISLGFAHRPIFNPLCTNCNSSKNNRMTVADVRQLIEHENNGQHVVSWHSKFIWDKLKEEVKTKEQSVKLSNLMVVNMHNVLRLMGDIVQRENGHEFLERLLKPDYAYFDYTFENFNPMDLSTLNVISKPLHSRNKEKNAERYKRVSFESIEQFNEKTNRRTEVIVTPGIDTERQKLFQNIRSKDYDSADQSLNAILSEFADYLTSSWV